MDKYCHLKRIVSLYKQGYGSSSIAREIGCSTSTVLRALRHAGVKVRSLSEATDLAWKRIGQFYRGADSSKWKGGRSMTAQGYVLVYCPEHPRARGNKGKYVFEHILVWEQYYQRNLPNGWIIHHLNGIKNDNRPENLVAMKRGHHIHQSEPYKRRIRELEAKVKFLERALDSQQLIWWSEN